MTKIGMFMLLAACMFAAAIADDSCPPANQIKPCTCDGEGANCMGKVSIEEIRRAFAAKFKYGGVRSVWIQGTPITSITKDLIGHIKVQEIFVEINNITAVDLDFLDGSYDSLSVLSLFGNKITQLDFAYFGKFKVLYTLNLARNQLTSLPANGFESYNLYTLILAENKISSVGAGAFSKLHNLQRLEMAQNQLTTLGPLSFTNKAPNLMINLVYNQISSVDPTAFNDTTPGALRLALNKLTTLPYNSFGALVTRMGQRGGGMDISSNPLSCTGCDYSWIVQNKQVLSYVIFGFLCTDGTTLQQLTKSKINC